LPKAGKWLAGESSQWHCDGGVVVAAAVPPLRFFFHACLLLPCFFARRRAVLLVVNEIAPRSKCSSHLHLSLSLSLSPAISHASLGSSLEVVR